MRKVEIYYNPYLESTRLFVDGKEHIHHRRRIDEFIVGKPMDSWLSSYVLSYHRWDGILAELIEELNDDEIELLFYSLPDYFPKVSDELQRQSTFIEEKGYSSKLWVFKGISSYAPDNMKAGILNFIQAKRHFAPDQYSMNLLDYAEQELQEESALSPAGLREMYHKLKEVIRIAEKSCTYGKENARSPEMWENADRELQKLFGGTIRHES